MPHFNYACSALYPNLTKKLKYRLQTTQNKCKRFCLQLDKFSYISHEEFERLNWLPVTYTLKQCVNEKRICVTKVPFCVFDKLKNKIQNFILRFCFYLNMESEIQIIDHYLYV